MSVRDDESQPEAEDDVQPSFLDHTKFMPPWRERMADGTLSPIYGPRTKGEFERMLAEHMETREAGSLWDRDTEVELHPERATRQVQKVAERYDAAKMTRFVERNSHRLTMRELEIFYLFYRDRKSKGAGARELGISKSTFENILLILRRKMKGSRSKDK